MAVVYQITNLVNGKRYIGVTRQSLRARRTKHFYDARIGKPFPIQKAIRLYGAEMFRFSVLRAYPDVAEALADEIRLIATLSPHYNVCSGGQGSFGHKKSPELRARLSAMKMGQIPWNLGRPHDQSTKDKIRARKLSSAQHPNCASSHRSNIAAAVKKMRKPVRCLSTGEVFESASAAARHMSVDLTAVAHSITRGFKVKGMSFEYVRAS